MAASSTETSRTVPPALVRVACVPSAAPKPPTRILAMERFMALAMSRVRIAPEAPTRAPATMRTTLPTTNPAIATAVPVNAFRSEMTPGISAPPIGRTIVTPKIRAQASAASSKSVRTWLSYVTTPAPARIITIETLRPATSSNQVKIRPPGIRMGWPLMRPINLAEAISEPVNVPEPMMTSAMMKRVRQPSRLSTPPARTRWPSRAMKSLRASSAAAAPPTALNRDTSWGMDVMATVRAIRSPRPPPRARPPIKRTQFPSPRPPWTTKTISATTAITMPVAEIRLPVRAVAGEFIKWRPMTKRAAPAMKESWTRWPMLLAFIEIPSSPGGLVGRSGRSSFEHLEHAIRDPVAANDVRSGEGHGHEGEHAGQRVVRRGGQTDRADEHDSMDRVGPGHQGRMKSGRDPADDFEAQQDRQDEDRQVLDQDVCSHALAPPRLAGCRSFLAASWITLPPKVMTVAAVISSLKSNCSSPFFTKLSSRLDIFRE